MNSAWTKPPRSEPEISAPPVPPFAVVLLFGPTASGKTGLLEQLSASPGAHNPFEVISADSMQVYRGMDIGTAKPGAALREKIPHHLLDIRSPDEQFNAGDFVRLADEACRAVFERGALPVVSGGTGFYLRNFMYGLSAAPPQDRAVRERLREELAERGSAALMEELAAVDSVSAARIHPNDTYRLLRALEVYRVSHLPLSSFAAGAETPRDRYRFVAVCLRRPRAELYRRIETRCDEMFRAGLADEVRALYEKGYTPEDPGMRAIGYREFFTEDFSGDTSGGKWKLSADIEGIRELVARNSRRYAKRQICYFSSIPGIFFLDMDSGGESGPVKTLLDLLSAVVHT